MACCMRKTSLGSSSTRRIVFIILRFLQLNPKVAAFLELRVETDLRVHAFDGLAHDGQANARSLVSRGRMNSLEEAENALVIFGSDADAVVLKPHADRSVTHRLRGNLEVWSGSGENEFYGVAQEVGNALGQKGFIAHDFGQTFFDANLRFDRLPAREGFNEVAHEAVQIHRLDGQPGVEDARVAQDILNEAVEPDGGAHNLLKVIDALFIELAGVFLQEIGGVAFHGPQGGAHVMRDAVRERFQLTDGFAKFAGAVSDDLLQHVGMATDDFVGVVQGAV